MTDEGFSTLLEAAREGSESAWATIYRRLSPSVLGYRKDGHDETLVRALPAAVSVFPDPALEAEMIPALAGAARSASLEASRVNTTTVDTTPAVAAPRRRSRPGLR